MKEKLYVSILLPKDIEKEILEKRTKALRMTKLDVDELEEKGCLPKLHWTIKAPFECGDYPAFKEVFIKELRSVKSYGIFIRGLNMPFGNWTKELIAMDSITCDPKTLPGLHTISLRIENPIEDDLMFFQRMFVYGLFHWENIPAGEDWYTDSEQWNTPHISLITKVFQLNLSCDETTLLLRSFGKVFGKYKNQFTPSSVSVFVKNEKKWELKEEISLPVLVTD